MSSRISTIDSSNEYIESKTLWNYIILIYIFLRVASLFLSLLSVLVWPCWVLFLFLSGGFLIEI
jgi:hypothetical protein